MIWRQCMEQEESIFGKEFIIKIARLIVGLTLALLGQFYLNENNFSLAVNLTVMLLSWIILAYDVLIDAIKDIIYEHEIFNEDFLMIIASIGAFPSEHSVRKQTNSSKVLWLCFSSRLVRPSKILRTIVPIRQYKKLSG